MFRHREGVTDGFVGALRGALCGLALVAASNGWAADHLPNAAAHIGTIVINNDDQFTTNSYVTLVVGAATNELGAVSQMQFSNDGNTWSVPEAYQSTTQWRLQDDGIYPLRMNTVLRTVYVRFRNGAGQWSKAVSDGIVLARSSVDLPRIKHVYIAQQRP